MKESLKRIGILVIAALALIAVFLFLYIKVPDFYYLVNYNCTQNEYYKKLFKETWNIDLPASRVLERESVNIGEAGGGIIYTVFQSGEAKDINWIPDCTQERDSEVEALAEGVVSDYFAAAGKNVSLPVFKKEYVWTYLTQYGTDLEADGIKTMILFYFPGEQRIYCMETAEHGVTGDK